MLLFYVGDTTEELSELPAGAHVTDSYVLAERWAQEKLAPVLVGDVDLLNTRGVLGKSTLVLTCPSPVVAVWWPFRDRGNVLLERALSDMLGSTRASPTQEVAELPKVFVGEERTRAVPCPRALRQFRVVNGREPTEQERKKLPWVVTSYAPPPDPPTSDKVKP